MAYRITVMTEENWQRLAENTARLEGAVVGVRAAGLEASTAMQAFTRAAMRAMESAGHKLFAFGRFGPWMGCTCGWRYGDGWEEDFERKAAWDKHVAGIFEAAATEQTT